MFPAGNFVVSAGVSFGTGCTIESVRSQQPKTLNGMHASEGSPRSDVKSNSASSLKATIEAGKDQNIYIVDRTNMGKFSPHRNNIYQEIDGRMGGGMYAMPADFRATSISDRKATTCCTSDFPRRSCRRRLSQKVRSHLPIPAAHRVFRAISLSNGIVWAIEHASPSVLHAYNASNLANELYNSNQAQNGRDQFGDASHFGSPIIVNGKVYFGTTNGIAVFGLLGR